MFNAGRWLAASVKCDNEAATVSRRKRRRSGPNDLEHGVNQAMTKIQLGELTAGRQALEAADLAPGTPDTLRQLRARPQEPRDPIPEVDDHIPPAPFELDRDKFGANLRAAKRGTAGGHQG